MITKVTEQGVLIPKEMFGDVLEVQIIQQDGMIIVVPTPAEDPIFQLGMNPVDADVTDGSINHDHYIYGSPRKS